MHSISEAQQAEEEEARRREEEERRKKEEEEEARKLHEAEEAVRREALEIQEVPADDPERKSIKFRCPSVPALNNLVFRFGKDTSVKVSFLRHPVSLTNVFLGLLLCVFSSCLSFLFLLFLLCE